MLGTWRSVASPVPHGVEPPLCCRVSSTICRFLLRATTTSPRAICSTAATATAFAMRREQRKTGAAPKGPLRCNPRPAAAKVPGRLRHKTMGAPRTKSASVVRTTLRSAEVRTGLLRTRWQRDAHQPCLPILTRKVLPWNGMTTTSTYRHCAPSWGSQCLCWQAQQDQQSLPVGSTCGSGSHSSPRVARLSRTMILPDNSSSFAASSRPPPTWGGGTDLAMALAYRPMWRWQLHQKQQAP